MLADKFKIALGTFSTLFSFSGIDKMLGVTVAMLTIVVLALTILEKYRKLTIKTPLEVPVNKNKNKNENEK